MNARNRKPITDLSTCHRCGMDSGERKESVNVPLRYYVRCGGCGYTVSGDSQSGATRKWNAMNGRCGRAAR